MKKGDWVWFTDSKESQERKTGQVLDLVYNGADVLLAIVVLSGGRRVAVRPENVIAAVPS